MAETGSSTNLETAEQSQNQYREDEEDEDEDEKILEVSKSKRWNKMAVQVPQREVPGIDNAYLAIDTEEGMEVVWNEVMYSQRKTRLNRKERLSTILSKVIKVKHRNIVSFYDFWLDKDNDNQDRLVFITEYMTSGSLLQFLKTRKRNPTAVGDKGRKVSKETPWKRWCKQILSALCYLHQKEIIHGNLTLGTVFIQHNGLVKIGAVSPDAIHQHVKTKNEEVRWMHYIAPEYADSPEITQAADIYAFGMCVLEMMGLLDSDVHPVRPEAIAKAISSLDSPKKNFVNMCLIRNPEKRASASELCHHPVLREVVPLKALSYLALPSRDDLEDSSTTMDLSMSWKGKLHSKPALTSSDITRLEEASKEFSLVKDKTVKSGPPPSDSSGNSEAQKAKKVKKKPKIEPENRKIQSITCDLKSEPDKRILNIRLLFDDCLRRSLTTEMNEGDQAELLARDLVTNGLISEVDREEVSKKISDKMSEHLSSQVTSVSSATAII